MEDATGPTPLRARRTRSDPNLGTTRPRTYEELRAVLSSATGRFPRLLRQVAIFVADHPSEVALGNTVAIARRARVQPSTLVRFAQHLGFPGFSDLQDVFKTYVRANWPDAATAPPMPDATAADDPDLRVIVGLARASVAALARVPETLDLAMFDRTASALAGADTIYLLGSKRAFPVVTYLSLALSQQGIKNSLVDNVGATAFEQIAFVSPRDAVLAVSFSPYNSITPALAAKAAQSGAPLLALTDSALSPLVPLAQAWIAVAEPEFGGFRPLAGTMTLGLALVLGVARRRGRVPAG